MIITTTVRQLLEVDRSRQRRGTDFARVIPPAAAVVNLLLCATFEPFLRETPAGYYHALFFLTECSVLVLLNLSYFGGKTSPVLRRTRIFPLTPRERYAFTLVVELRRRIVLGLFASTVGFLALFFRANLLAALSAVVIYLLMALAVEIVTSAFALLLLRTPHPAALGVALGGAAVILLSIGLILFDISELLAAVPLINWGAAGILAGGRGDTSGALLHAGFISATAVMGLFAGSRYA